MEKTPVPKFRKPTAEYKRLQFLKDFMLLYHVSQIEIAEHLKCTTAAVSHQLTGKDDIRLSDVRKIVAMRDCSLDIHIFRHKDDAFSGFDPSDYAVDESNGMRLAQKPLMFLSAAMKMYGWTKAELAKRMDVNISSVNYWFNTAKDIYMSRLMQCVEIMGLNIHITIKPNSVPEFEEGRQQLIYEINCTNRTCIGQGE